MTADLLTTDGTYDDDDDHYVIEAITIDFHNFVHTGPSYSIL